MLYWGFYSIFKEKDVYRPNIREGIRALIAWEWSFERSKEAADTYNTGPRLRRISQSSMVMAHYICLYDNLLVKFS